MSGDIGLSGERPAQKERQVYYVVHSSSCIGHIMAFGIALVLYHGRFYPPSSGHRHRGHPVSIDQRTKGAVTFRGSDMNLERKSR